MYFNSIKVRLEHNNLQGELYQASPFQFHKGTIRTPLCPIPRTSRIDFNSIKVRLELDALDGVALGEVHFNSIKVRLELDLNEIKVATSNISIP